jgi:AraC-like DNA-binding protein
MSYRVDLYAVFMFLGIVQGIFLCLFFFSRENRKIKANVFEGLMLASMILCLVEIFLNYTGYIINFLFLVDFSEPVAFLIGPCFYLLVISLIQGEIRPKQYGHFAPPVLYLLLLIPFFLLPEDTKYNCWISAYKLDLPYRPGVQDPRIFWITDHATEMTLLSLIIYSILSLIKIAQAFRVRKESFRQTTNPVFRNLRNGIIQVISVTIFVIVIKIFNENDTGDHVFSAYMSILIYFTSFRVIRQSGFFKQPSLAEPLKYKNSTVTPEAHQSILLKLKEIMDHEKPFLQGSFSLPDLAHRVGTTVHTLSQIINEGLGKSFFEMTALYRVEEAKLLLKAQRNVKVEEIAEQVGYHSKSSFNNAFKKITGMTPSEFRESDR